MMDIRNLDSRRVLKFQASNLSPSWSGKRRKIGQKVREINKKKKGLSFWECLSKVGQFNRPCDMHYLHGLDRHCFLLIAFFDGNNVRNWSDGAA